MTPQEFARLWTSGGGHLSPLKVMRLLKLNLRSNTLEYLTQAGLPQSAAPFLSFVDNSSDKNDGIARLTDQYNFLAEEYRKWIVIGSCGNGDPIAINTEMNDRI